MSELTGSAILAKALRRQGCDEMFFLMGGPDAAGGDRMRQ